MLTVYEMHFKKTTLNKVRGVQKLNSPNGLTPFHIQGYVIVHTKLYTVFHSSSWGLSC